MGVRRPPLHGSGFSSSHVHALPIGYVHMARYGMRLRHLPVEVPYVSLVVGLSISFNEHRKRLSMIEQVHPG